VAIFICQCCRGNKKEEQQTLNAVSDLSKRQHQSSVNTDLPLVETGATASATSLGDCQTTDVVEHVTYAVIGSGLQHNLQHQQQFEESTQCSVIYADLERVVKNV
jgi:hypothetical protein